MLSINEEFFSIQGEGLNTGIPMYFVRLQGCLVRCHFCDTKYTWQKSTRLIDEQMTIDRARKSEARWICITGGEPYEQDLQKLVTLATKAHLNVCVETSGGAEYQHMIPAPDWITLSPKDLFTQEQYYTRKSYKLYANEIKCVVTKKEDIDHYEKNYYQWCNYEKPMILQPVDNNIDITRMCLHEVQTRGLKHTRVMLQTHKFMGLR